MDDIRGYADQLRQYVDAQIGHIVLKELDRVGLGTSVRRAVLESDGADDDEPKGRVVTAGEIIRQKQRRTKKKLKRKKKSRQTRPMAVPAAGQSIDKVERAKWRRNLLAAAMACTKHGSLRADEIRRIAKHQLSQPGSEKRLYTESTLYGWLKQLEQESAT